MAEVGAEQKKQVDSIKATGNQALEKGDFEEAIRLYTEALGLDEKNHVLYSNRSAAKTKGGQYLEALADAEMAIEIKPDWAKGYSRKGTALCYLNRYEEASLAFEEGLKLDPDNKQLQSGLKEAKSHLTGPGGSQPLNNLFGAPDVMAKLEANPQTREFLKDPTYRMYIELMKQNPSALQSIKDPRIITTLGVLLGVDLQTMSADDLKNQGEGDAGKDSESPEPPPEPKPGSQTNAKSESQTNDETHNVSKQQALAEKEKGNAAYKSKNFEEALQYYNKASELDPTNMTFHLNIAAVYFEQQEFDKCISTSEKAIDIGRENRADYPMIAKAFARIGRSYLKKGDDENALKFFNKSISEHRAPDVTKLVQEIQKKIKEKEKLAYLNPELADEERNKGNDLFKAGKYPDAIKHYTEAIKRHPNDPKNFSNRAACYTKLMEFNMALKDCEECLKVDPNFLKGYLRKGTILVAMKEPTKAAQAYSKALEIDPKCQEAQEGYRNAVMAEGNDPEAVRKRAMADPEVQQILGDPAMRMILEQMQKDPNAVREHLKNPEVASKIEKLLECGIIAIR